jgi:hypothetical protein
MRSRRSRIVLIGFVCIVWTFWYFKFAGHHLLLQKNLVPEHFWGITFSKKYAEELGIDWRAAYTAALDDLGVSQVRLPVYWDDIERTKGVYDFSDYDWMLAEGAKRNTRFVLNIGRRLPRWPECHQPDWTNSLSPDAMKQAHLAMTTAAIDHFKGVSAIGSWQLENEYFFPWFGECPKADEDLIRQEIKLLRERDPRPLILTDSGELNTWRKAARYSDTLGITIYRVVWNNYFGYFRWPWPAWFYRLKSQLAGKEPSTTIVAELQAEPWPSHFQKVQNITASEAAKSFTVRQFTTNAEIARRTGFQQAYFWGVEWWYWLKVKGDSSIWDVARSTIQNLEQK